MKETCIEKERKQNEEIEELRRKNREDNIMLNELREENKKLRQELHEVKTEMESLRAESKSHQNLKPEETLSYKRLKLECAQKDQKINDQKEILENLRVEKEEKSKEVEILNNHLQKKNEETNHGNTDEPLLVEGLFAYMNDKVDDAKNLFEKLLSSSVSNKESALLRILLAKTKAAFDNPDHLEIILNCCEAIEKGLKGRNVHLLRGERLSEHGLYDAAREDFELVLSLKNSEDCLQKVDEVKKKVQMWEDFNHYQVLGVEQNAKKSEILKAHKNLAMKYHPDRHRNKPQFLLDAFENKYKRICNAKAVLTDEQDRHKYDQELQRHRLNNNQQHQRPGRQAAGNHGHNNQGPTRGFEFNNHREQPRGFYSPRGAKGFEFNNNQRFARQFGFKFPQGQGGFHFGNIFDLFDEYYKGNE
ncbi:dnaJ homolog subfamily C member 3-like [Palaemon carinicauda]|uniref:dnaJ homolog subfamily C member 3-like n=1 Tax=Palaemon carinicauda TaxID=392227 RepID=UPI0035B5B331